MIVADHNYGEGSSREHAAMEPRWLGCLAILVRSIARIAETNLKKQGILPLTFSDPASYDLFQEEDRMDILGLADLEPDRPMKVVLTHPDGTRDEFECSHSLNPEQVHWIHAGSALNLIRQQTAS